MFSSHNKLDVHYHTEYYTLDSSYFKPVTGNCVATPKLTDPSLKTTDLRHAS